MQPAPRGRRTADELVWRDEYRVLVGQRASRVGGVHVDIDVGRRGGKVPEAERSVLVEERGDRRGVGHDAGDVRCRRERADLQRSVRVLLELDAQVVAVHSPVGVLPDHHHVGDRLPPRNLVGMVLIRTHEHDRPLSWRYVLGQRVQVIEHRRHPQPEDADQLGDGPGAARPREDDHAVVSTTDCGVDDLPRLLAQPRGLQTGAARLRVGVGIARQHLVADEVLDEAERPPRRGVVGVGHPSPAVRRLHHVVVTDHGVADQPQQCLGVASVLTHGVTICLGAREVVRCRHHQRLLVWET